MRTIIHSLILTTVISLSACSQSSQRDEAASDTASVLDSTRLNSTSDTTAVENVKGNTSPQSTNPTQYEESNGKQGPRTNVGEDTTGKQPHDQKP